jgi:SAM-dependent methyltransferase
MRLMNPPQTAQAFDPDPATYDALIDWERRLAREAPFYRRLFEAVGARRVLDVACGTGRHAAMFHSWNLEVTGADVSPEMIDFARQRHGSPPRLRWKLQSFDLLHDPPSQFDAAICVGNSLAIAQEAAAAGRVLNAMAASIRAGGLVVVQVLNLERIAEGPVLWQKCRRLADEDGDRILLKGVHRLGRRGYVEIVELNLADGDVTPRYRTAMLNGFSRDELTAMAAEAGLDRIELFGDYERHPFDPSSSQDLILTGRRAR